MGFRTGDAYHEPNNAKDIDKRIISLGHVSGYKYGQNLAVLDYLLSSEKDPANSGNNGATEFYLAYRHQLQLSKVQGAPAKVGIIRDFAFTAGFDLETKNSSLAPAKRMVVAGPTFKFDVPGFLDLSILYARETGQCGVPPCKLPGNNTSVAFDPFLRLELAWGIPFSAGPVPLKFQGWSFYNAKKGKNYTNVETEAEFLVRPSLMADVGQLAFGTKNALWVGVGYEYRRNTYGNHDMAGVNTSTPTLNLEWHF